MAKAVKQWSKKYQMLYFENLENNIFVHHIKTLYVSVSYVLTGRQ